jgi:sulfur carrier protein ThiS
MASEASVSVRFGNLTEPLRTSTVRNDTNVVDFLKRRDVEYGSSVRVNGNTVNREYVLRNGDVVTAIESVSGGIL